VTNTATSGANADWDTTASGFKKVLATYVSGANANIWNVHGAVLHHGTSSSVVRMPGNGNAGGIAAYAYTVPADM
jgi:glycerate kinase